MSWDGVNPSAQLILNIYTVRGGRCDHTPSGRQET